jgi:1,6-anhydro-N-acetylmuramate kinase
VSSVVQAMTTAKDLSLSRKEEERKVRRLPVEGGGESALLYKSRLSTFPNELASI